MYETLTIPAYSLLLAPIAHGTSTHLPWSTTACTVRTTGSARSTSTPTHSSVVQPCSCPTQPPPQHLPCIHPTTGRALALAASVVWAQAQVQLASAVWVVGAVCGHRCSWCGHRCSWCGYRCSWCGHRCSWCRHRHRRSRARTTNRHVNRVVEACRGVTHVPHSKHNVVPRACGHRAAVARRVCRHHHLPVHHAERRCVKRRCPKRRVLVPPHTCDVVPEVARHVCCTELPREHVHTARNRSLPPTCRRLCVQLPKVCTSRSRQRPVRRAPRRPPVRTLHALRLKLHRPAPRVQPSPAAKPARRRRLHVPVSGHRHSNTCQQQHPGCHHGRLCKNPKKVCTTCATRLVVWLRLSLWCAVLSSNSGCLLLCVDESPVSVCMCEGVHCGVLHHLISFCIQRTKKGGGLLLFRTYSVFLFL